jgi:hypothetical protein
MRPSRRRTCAELYRAVGPERVSCAAAPALLAVSGPVADCGVPCRLPPSVLTATAAAFCVDRVFPAAASGKGACLRLRRPRRVSRLSPLVTVGLSPRIIIPIASTRRIASTLLAENQSLASFPRSAPPYSPPSSKAWSCPIPSAAYTRTAIDPPCKWQLEQGEHSVGLSGTARMGSQGGAGRA